MKRNLYLLALGTVWILSCENRKPSLNNEVITKNNTFPYKLDSVPAAWVSHHSDWFEFYTPPGWLVNQRLTLDSEILEIRSPDTTTVLMSDDYGFGLQQAGIKHTSWPEDITDVDTLSGEGQLYYNLEKNTAALILYGSYWMSTGDSLTSYQFETACKVLQTIKLQPRVFSSDYFKSYRDGALFQEARSF